MRQDRLLHELTVAIAVASLVCGCGGGSRSGDTTIRFQLATAQEVTGLASVRLTAGSTVKTLALDSLSPAAMTFDLPVPATLTGTVAVSALARPASGCMGLAAAGTAYVTAGGSVETVTLLMAPQDICQTAGTGGSTGGAGGTSGGAGTGGSIVGTAGTGGSAGGTSGAGGMGGLAGTTGSGGATAGGGGVVGRGGSGGVGGQPSCMVAVGGRPAPAGPPSLARCIEYSQNAIGAACSTSTNANNAFINDIAVSPDGNYLATVGSHQLSSPTATDGANDRVRIWRMVGNTPTPCGSIDISNPGMGPGYVAFSPNGQYLAVAWRRDYVYVYSVPGFTMVGSIKSSYGPLYGVGFSPDSQTVFSVDYDSTLSDGTLYADSVNGDPVALGQAGVDPDVLAVSPVAGTGNTSTIAVGGYLGNAAVYTFNGTTISAPMIVSTGPQEAAWAARFNPAGTLLAIGTDEGYIRFWSIPLTSTSPVGTPIDVGPNTVFQVAFSPQGTHIAAAIAMETDIFNVSTRAFVSLAASGGYVDAVSFSASGAAVISGGDSCGRVFVCAD